MGAKKPQLFAHRGGNAEGAKKENTLSAFRSAEKLGFTRFETDVVVTKDRYVIAYHGSRTKKQARAGGFATRDHVQSLNYAEVLQFVRPCGEDVPLLSDLLKTFPKVIFSVDAKTNEVVDPLSEVIRANNAIDRVNITSFSLKRVLGLAELLGGTNKVNTSLCIHPKMAVFLSYYPSRYFRYLSSKGISGVHFPHQYLNKRVTKAGKRTNMDIYAWTVNREEDINKCLSLGVAGIISDETEKLAQLAM